MPSKWRAANRELAVARAIASRKKKPEHYREKQRELMQRDLAKHRARYKQYMTQKSRAMPPWVDDEHLFLMREAYDLAQRRGAATGFKWHVDHQVPLQSPIVCGLHVIDNLQVIPGALNVGKGNRHWPGMPT